MIKGLMIDRNTSEAQKLTRAGKHQYGTTYYDLKQVLAYLQKVDIHFPTVLSLVE